MAMIRVPYDELRGTLRAALQRAGMGTARADACAAMFADATLDGVASHGVARFPRFMEMIRDGVVDVSAQAQRIATHGALERWNGNRGPGNLNAAACMAAAIVLSRAHGIGCVALANTNHWMRGGTYGWQAADAGAIAICWTNTLPNMPPWGAADARVGNNPLVVAVPRPPAHVVLDMALSQFSVGALAARRAAGGPLPVFGGFDEAGELTRDPAAIEATGRLLPAGFWKGSGLALLLDLLAAALARGRSTREIPADSHAETGLSQVFIAFDPDVAGGAAAVSRLADETVRHFQHGTRGHAAVRYPGERALAARAINLERGVPMDPRLWEQLVRYTAPS
jgi:3-dehydro-L-gulonate 2-dehydrogenase